MGSRRVRRELCPCTWIKPGNTTLTESRSIIVKIWFAGSCPITDTRSQRIKVVSGYPRIIESHLSGCDCELRDSRHQLIAVTISPIDIPRNIKVFDSCDYRAGKFVIVTRGNSRDPRLTGDKTVAKSILTDPVRGDYAETGDNDSTSLYQHGRLLRPSSRHSELLAERRGAPEHYNVGLLLFVPI